MLHVIEMVCENLAIFAVVQLTVCTVIRVNFNSKFKIKWQSIL